MDGVGTQHRFTILHCLRGHAWNCLRREYDAEGTEYLSSERFDPRGLSVLGAVVYAGAGRVRVWRCVVRDGAVERDDDLFVARHLHAPRDVHERSAFVCSELKSDRHVDAVHLEPERRELCAVQVYLEARETHLTVRVHQERGRAKLVARTERRHRGLRVRLFGVEVPLRVLVLRGVIGRLDRRLNDDGGRSVRVVHVSLVRRGRVVVVRDFLTASGEGGDQGHNQDHDRKEVAELRVARHGVSFRASRCVFHAGFILFLQESLLESNKNNYILITLSQNKFIEKISITILPYIAKIMT